MNINSITGSSSILKAYPTIYKEIPGDSGGVDSPTTDRVDLSGQVQATQTDGIRADKVADIKAQIAAGTYETDDKIDATVNRMLNDVIGGE